jgi:hypothetical protein
MKLHAMLAVRQEMKKEILHVLNPLIKSDPPVTVGHARLV